MSAYHENNDEDVPLGQLYPHLRRSNRNALSQGPAASSAAAAAAVAAAASHSAHTPAPHSSKKKRSSHSKSPRRSRSPERKADQQRKSSSKKKKEAKAKVAQRKHGRDSNSNSNNEEWASPSEDEDERQDRHKSKSSSSSKKTKKRAKSFSHAELNRQLKEQANASFARQAAGRVARLGTLVKMKDKDFDAMAEEIQSLLNKAKALQQKREAQAANQIYSNFDPLFAQASYKWLDLYQFESHYATHLAQKLKRVIDKLVPKNIYDRVELAYPNQLSIYTPRPVRSGVA